MLFIHQLLATAPAMQISNDLPNVMCSVPFGSRIAGKKLSAQLDEQEFGKQPPKYLLKTRVNFM